MRLIAKGRPHLVAILPTRATGKKTGSVTATEPNPGMLSIANAAMPKTHADGTMTRFAIVRGSNGISWIAQAVTRAVAQPTHAATLRTTCVTALNLGMLPTARSSQGKKFL